MKFTEVYHRNKPFFECVSRIRTVLKEYNPDLEGYIDSDCLVVDTPNTSLTLVFDLGYEENWEALDTILELL